MISLRNSETERLDDWSRDYSDAEVTINPSKVRVSFCKSVAKLKDSWSHNIQSSVLITTKAIKNTNSIFILLLQAVIQH